jgi:hypothetical protein
LLPVGSQEQGSVAVPLPSGVGVPLPAESLPGVGVGAPPALPEEPPPDEPVPVSGGIEPPVPAEQAQESSGSQVKPSPQSAAVVQGPIQRGAQ